MNPSSSRPLSTFALSRSAMPAASSATSVCATEFQELGRHSQRGDIVGLRRSSYEIAGLLIGFVHEFRPFDEAQITKLLNQRWAPAGVTLPDEILAPDVIASLIRMSAGNFPVALTPFDSDRAHPEGERVHVRFQGDRSRRSRQLADRSGLILAPLRQITLKALRRIALQATVLDPSLSASRT